MMNIEVTLRVSGIDLDDPGTADVLGELFPSLLWQGEGRCITVSFEVREQNAPAEVLDVVRALETAVPGFVAVRVDRDLVSTSDIATRVGVSREAVRKWSLETDFPVPFATVSGNKHAWAWGEVLVWLDASRGMALGERQPTEAVAVQIDNCLMKNPDATTVRWERVSRPAPRAKAISATFRDVVPLEEWREQRQMTGVRSALEHSLRRMAQR